MKRHTQHYFDLNPRPSAWGLIRAGLGYLGLVVYGAGVVYLATVVLFSF